MSIAPLALLMAAPSFGYGSPICTDTGICSVYGYVEYGQNYLLSDESTDPDAVDPQVHEKMTHFKYENGRWLAFAATPPVPPAINHEIVFDVTFGSSGMKPVVGDWDGDGYDDLGVAFPWAGGTRFIRGKLSYNGPGAPSVMMYQMPLFINVVGGTPIVGDWDGDGIDSVGVYKDGIFTLVNNSAPTSALTMNLAALLPADPVAAAEVQPTTWPWNPNTSIDYVALSLPDRVVAVSSHFDGYVFGSGGLGNLIYLFQSYVSGYDPLTRPVVFPPPAGQSGNVGAYIAPLGHCFDLVTGQTCDPSTPETNGGAVRPGDSDTWFP